MAIAVVNHADLLKHSADIGFPQCTKVSCQSGMNGYQVWDRWIRANVHWVSELGFDPDAHVKITESAQLVGELKNPWELRCQKFVEGSEETNTFQALNVDGEEFSLHVNRQAIQVAVSNASLRYKIDFETSEDGSVVTFNRLAVAVFHRAEDSSLSYQSDLDVAQLWTTKVEHVDEPPSQPVLFKRAYADDPLVEESYPWIVVGKLDIVEYELWLAHNVVEKVTIEEAASQVGRSLNDAFTKSESLVDRAVKAFPLANAYAATNPITATTKESFALPNAGLSEATFVTLPASYPPADESGVSGDV